MSRFNTVWSVKSSHGQVREIHFYPDGSVGVSLVQDGDGEGPIFSASEWRAIVAATKSVWGVQNYESLDALVEETKRKAKD